MQPFDLERFKAGEPAYDKDTHEEYFYLADLPDGKIVVKYIWHDGWRCLSLSIPVLNDVYYMKEKELTYVELWKMWATGKSDIAEFIPSFDKWLDENCEPPKRKNK